MNIFSRLFIRLRSAVFLVRELLTLTGMSSVDEVKQTNLSKQTDKTCV